MCGLSRRRHSHCNSGGVRFVVATIPVHCCVSCTRGRCRTCEGLCLQVSATSWPTVACPGRFCPLVPTGRCNLMAWFCGVVPDWFPNQPGQLVHGTPYRGCTVVPPCMQLLVPICTSLYRLALPQHLYALDRYQAVQGGTKRYKSRSIKRYKPDK